MLRLSSVSESEVGFSVDDDDLPISGILHADKHGTVSGMRWSAVKSKLCQRHLQTVILMGVR